jgi:hypothetical protein
MVIVVAYDPAKGLERNNQVVFKQFLVEESTKRPG